MLTTLHSNMTCISTSCLQYLREHGDPNRALLNTQIALQC